VIEGQEISVTFAKGPMSFCMIVKDWLLGLIARALSHACFATYCISSCRVHQRGGHPSVPKYSTETADCRSTGPKFLECRVKPSPRVQSIRKLLRSEPLGRQSLKSKGDRSKQWDESSARCKRSCYCRGKHIAADAAANSVELLVWGRPTTTECISMCKSKQCFEE